MSFATSCGPVRALVLGFVLVGAAGPAWAQKKVSNASAPTAAPRPTSPVASSPQVILPAPAATMQVSRAALEPKNGMTGWLTDLAAAQAQAKATNRPILAVFSGSDWCKPCIMYEQEVFAKPEFSSYAKDKLVLAHFDFPRQKRNLPTAAQVKLNEAAAAQLNHEGDFPLAVLVSPEGKVLAKTGYIAGGPAAFEAYLNKVLPTL